jgi:hypothetical protein
MKEKRQNKASFGQILRSHPLPGLRFARDPDGKAVAIFGRPGLWSKDVQLRSEKEVAPPTDETANPVAEMTTAEKLWLDGVAVWNRIPGASPEQVEVLQSQAAQLFGQALELDSGMTDAMLGIHATVPERRVEMSRAMYESLDRFGETRDRFATRLHSIYFPLVFAAEQLESRDDLLRARAKDLAVEGDYEGARNCLAGTEDCLLNDLSAIDILFHQEDLEGCLKALDSIRGNGELSVYLHNDLELVEGLALLRLGVTGAAKSSLHLVSETAELPVVEFFARYELAHLAMKESDYRSAIEQLEIINYQEPGYRDVGTLLELVSSKQQVQTVTDADFDQLVSSFYSEEIADDPGLPDNWKG